MTSMDAYDTMLLMGLSDEAADAKRLKYAYLLLAPPATLDLNAVVFDTEAHPLRVMR
jgi:Glycosyl hydrolase family 47